MPFQKLRIPHYIFQISSIQSIPQPHQQEP